MGVKDYGSSLNTTLNVKAAFYLAVSLRTMNNIRGIIQTVGLSAYRTTVLVTLKVTLWFLVQLISSFFSKEPRSLY